jgi:hypothetical protein
MKCRIYPQNPSNPMIFLRNKFPIVLFLKICLKMSIRSVSQCDALKQQGLRYVFVFGRDWPGSCPPKTDTNLEPARICNIRLKFTAPPQDDVTVGACIWSDFRKNKNYSE